MPQQVGFQPSTSILLHHTAPAVHKLVVVPKVGETRLPLLGEQHHSLGWDLGPGHPVLRTWWPLLALGDISSHFLLLLTYDNSYSRKWSYV